MSALSWPQFATQSGSKRILVTSEASGLISAETSQSWRTCERASGAVGVTPHGESPVTTRNVAGDPFDSPVTSGSRCDRATRETLILTTSRGTPQTRPATERVAPILQPVKSGVATQGTDKCAGSVRWALRLG